MKGDPEHPLSGGYTCRKGRAIGAIHQSPHRLNHPTIGRADARSRVRWVEALDDIARSVERSMRADGPDAVGLYVGTAGSLDAAAGFTARRFIRKLGSRSYFTSATVDSPNKPLVAELMGGFAGLIPHVDPTARLTLVIGCNPVVSHGHFQAFPNPRGRLRQLAETGELWVMDPRVTETARLADRHIRSRAGTDHILLAGLVKALLVEVDRAALLNRAYGVDALAAAVEPFDVATVVRRCGIRRDDFEDLVAAVAAGPFAALTGTGVSMSIGANVSEWLLWAALILTDSMEQPGGMWFNAGFLQSLDRLEAVPRRTGPEPGTRARPDVPGRRGERPSATIAAEIEAGFLRALFVIGGNPAIALPAADRVHDALRRLEMLAVADIVPTGTTDVATHVLPSVGHLERADLPWIDAFAPDVAAQYTPAIVAPGGERRSVWWMLGQLGQRLGVDVLNGLDPDRSTDDDVLRMLAVRAKASFDELKAASGPIVHEPSIGWVRERVLPDRRWALAPRDLVEQLRSLEATADADRPGGLTLLPMRQQNHVNSTFPSSGVAARDGRSLVHMHPDDAARVTVPSGGAVRVVGAGGTLRATVAIDADAPLGSIAIPHGFVSCNANAVTDSDALDGLTGMPVLAAVPVQVERDEPYPDAATPPRPIDKDR